MTRPLANFVLSNVPGGAETMYLNGARLVGSYPDLRRCGMRVGLNVTLTSYADTMDFGFVGNGTTMNDLPDLARHVADAYEELKAAARRQRRARAVARSAPRAASVRAARTRAARTKGQSRREMSDGTHERRRRADALPRSRRGLQPHDQDLTSSIPPDDPEGWSWKRFKAAWASRVGLVPRLRQRYLRVPLGLNHPVWVDDPAFDIDYHLRRVGCPAPGTMVELCELVCELYAHPLDHTRPLWQIWVVEGLRGRARRASCCSSITR